MTRRREDLPVTKGGVANKVAPRTISTRFAKDGEGFVVDNGIIRTVGVTERTKETLHWDSVVDFDGRDRDNRARDYTASIPEGYTTDTGVIEVLFETIGREVYYVVAREFLNPTTNKMLAVIYYQLEGDNKMYKTGTYNFRDGDGQRFQGNDFRITRVDYGVGTQLVLIPNFKVANPEAIRSSLYQFFAIHKYEFGDDLSGNKIRFSRLTCEASTLFFPSRAFDLSLEEDLYITYSTDNGLRFGNSIPLLKKSERLDIEGNILQSSPIGETTDKFLELIPKTNSENPDLLSITGNTTRVNVSLKLNSPSSGCITDIRYKTILDNVALSYFPPGGGRAETNKLSSIGTITRTVSFMQTQFDLSTHTINMLKDRGRVNSFAFDSTRPQSRFSLERYTLWYTPNSEEMYVSLEFSVINSNSLGTLKIKSLAVRFVSETTAVKQPVNKITVDSDDTFDSIASASFRGVSYHQGKDGIRGLPIASAVSTEQITTDLYFPSVRVPSFTGMSSSPLGLSLLDVFNPSNPRLLSISRSETSEDVALSEYLRLFRLQDYDVDNALLGSYSKYIYLLTTRLSDKQRVLLFVDRDDTNTAFIQEVPNNINKILVHNNQLIAGGVKDNKVVTYNIFDYQATGESTFTSGLTPFDSSKQKRADGITVDGRMTRGTEIDVFVTTPADEELYSFLGTITASDTIQDSIEDINGVPGSLTGGLVKSEPALSPTELVPFSKRLNFSLGGNQLTRNFRYFGYRVKVRGGAAEINAPIIEGLQLTNQP